MSISDKEIAAVSILNREDRLSHLIKRVAGFYEVWGIEDREEGWAFGATKDGTLIFQIWPFAEYAALCCTGEWANCVPKSIGMEDFLDSYLTDFEERSILVGAFYTPNDNGVLISSAEFRKLLEPELEKY